MSKWKCEICNSEFDNFQAQGFNDKIYCPLCYFKELYKRGQKENKRLRKEYIVLQNASDKVEDKLNNNWNKLEEYIRSYINLLVNNPDMIEQGQLDILYEVLDKMKEIKDSDKE